MSSTLPDTPVRHLTSAALLALAFVAIGAVNARGGNPADPPSSEPFDAVARVDLIRADPGGYAGQLSADPNRGATSGAVTLSLETTHVVFGRGWDASLDIDGGFQPLFVMVKAPSWPTVRPAFINGLVTMTGPRIAHASSSTETAVFGHIGTARLSSKSTVVGSGGAAERATIAANDIAEWALFFDGGVEFRWYDRDAREIHRTNRTGDPWLRLAGGFKHDQRLHRGGDLADYKDPTGRVYFGAEVMPVRLTRGTSDAHRDPLVAIGGGFALESALRTTGRLPSGFRASVSARLDLVSAFR